MPPTTIRRNAVFHCNTRFIPGSQFEKPGTRQTHKTISGEEKKNRRRRRRRFYRT